MIRLHFVVEGKTEKLFVERIVTPHLAGFSVLADARPVETSRGFRGGVIDFGRVKRDIETWMKQDSHPDVYFTSMIDLFRLPSDFPGYASARALKDPYARVEVLETEFKKNIDNGWRFIPYIQLHEFEALILADPVRLDWEFLEHEKAIQQLVDLAAGYNSPEEINDRPETAPSKRIIAKIPEYEGRKASAGPLVAEKIGLPKLRERCPHFHEWIATLEGLK